MPRKHNHNEGITLPAPGLPVLLKSARDKADGRIPGYTIQNDVHVRVLPLEALYLLTSSDPRQNERFATEYGAVPEPWRFVLIYVARALHETVHGTRAGAQRAIWEHFIASDAKWLAAIRDPRDVLVGMLSEGLREGQEAVKFVLWQNDKPGCLAGGLLCPDARTAAFALLVGTFGQPSGLGVCARCGKPFRALKGIQRYCSSRCQTAAAMARYRSRLANGAKGKSQRKSHARKSKAKPNRRK